VRPGASDQKCEANMSDGGAGQDGRRELQVSRRQFVASGVAGALALGGVACGSAKTRSTTSNKADTGKPVRGGTFTVGMITAGAAETLDPGVSIALVDTLRCEQLYNLLFEPGPDIKTLVPRLATSAEPNKDATVWTFQLRPGVEWHDGKSFTADDVVYNFQLWGKSSNYNNALFAGTVDFKSVRKRGPLTVEVPLLKPVAQFPSILSFSEPFIVQAGATKASFRTNPIGTGPFKFESFDPGKQSVFVRNPNYWEDNGKPYVDRVVINSSFSDETARLNALLGGQLNVLSWVPPTVASTHKSSSQLKILSAHSPDPYVILMRVDKGPFADVRVRQALKLIADRQALVETALSGWGVPANDLIGVGCEYHLDLPAPKQDIEKAKSLLNAAGQSDLSFSLPTSNAVPGFVEAATIYAQQCSEAGVKCNVKNIPASTYYTSSAGFLTRPICMDNGTTYQSLTALYQTWYATGAPYNETFWGHQQPGGAEAQKLITQAIAELDPSKAADLWHEVQMQQFNEGGTLAYANVDYIDAVAPKVHGLKATPARNLNNGRLLDGWIA
jgi:peptide/nickel transport system substrate-binding protein